ncbi:MAG: TetR/AcrR family transcriptional regulator [Myxococcota bacterium]
MNETPADGRTVRAAKAREHRRAQILEAALEVFARQGYHQTSVSDLVEAAGVARGTFYLYFDGKSAIFHELVDNLLATLRATISGVDTTVGAAPIPVQLTATLSNVLNALSDNRALCRILFREAVGLDDDVDAKLQLFYEGLRRYVQMALDNGQKLGFVRPIDTEVAASCALGAVKEVVSRYLVRNEDEVDLQTVARGVLDYSLRGVGA